MEVIVIISHNQKERMPILLECLNSIRTHYPIMIVDPGNGQEIGALKHVYDNTKYTEIFLLHDTAQVKDNSLFEIVFEKYKNRSVCLSPKYLMLMGKYRREVLDKLELPVVHSKLESYQKAETIFNQQYINADGRVICLTPEFHDGTAKHEYKWGRENLRLESEYLVKWKGSWSMDHLLNEDLYKSKVV